MIPKTIIHALEHQDLSVLCEIRDLVEHLIKESGKPLLAEDLPDDREVLDVQTTGCITYRLEKVSCGKRSSCKGCRHRSHAIGMATGESSKTHSKYIGKSLSPRNKKKVQ